jgi:thiol-disulfide isomerase/thioredoxin
VSVQQIMSMGEAVLLVSVLVALVFGSWRAVTSGRFRRAVDLGDSPDAGIEPLSKHWELFTAGVELGERATLVQFSSAFCAPCRATRRVLTEVSAVVPGVVHVEINAEHHLALVRELGILRTPTTLVLDAHGRETRRATGAPRKQAVVAALDEAIS